jgi:GDP-4-dehydro-6-deoxy-D-mannose reductase
VRVWLTGASGFVGGHLLPRLRALGAELSAPRREALDVTDEDALLAHARAFRPDAIVHLAAQSSVAASARDPRSGYRMNFGGALGLLRAVERAAPRARVLLVGSSEVYGQAASEGARFDESSPLRPRSPYAASKAAADLLGRAFAQRGLDVVRPRPFTHTGPGQSDAFAASSFARQLAEMEAGLRPPLLAVGNLDSVRDYLDVEDVVDAYLRLLEPGVPAGVYNVASGAGVRLGALLEILIGLSRVRPEIRVDPERLRSRDVSVGDAGRLSEATGWAPRLPLRLTLERLLDDWRARVRAPREAPTSGLRSHR